MPDDRTHRVYPPILERARDLRHPQTPAEARVWQRVRNQQLGGFKFRRQHVIGRFVVDFYCAESRLIVEIDGDSHVEQAEYDAARTERLNEQGYRVIRFANRDVLHHLDAVLDAVLAECRRLAIGDQGDNIMADKVIMYTLATCPVCVMARDTLKQRGVAFEDRIVDDRPDWAMEVVRLSNQSTVPVIVWTDGRVEIGIDGERG